MGLRFVGVGVACALALLAPACGGDGDDAGSSNTGGNAGATGGSSGSTGGTGTGGSGTGGSTGGTSGSGGSSSGGTAGASTGGASGSGGGLTFGYPVYTQVEIDAWSTSSPEYTRLASSWAGNVNRPYTSYGTEISSVERDLLKDESGYMKVQAVLWAADGNEARKTKVATMLDELRSVTSWEWDAVEQYRLVAGWACTNLAQAAAIIDYQDPDFKTFLTDECYPILDWTGGGNWHASFADSKLAIAAYIEDPGLWADAKAYFEKRIGQSIFHSTYDGTKVLPLLSDNGNPNVALTKSHWGGYWGVSQIKDDFTPVDPSLFPDGVNAERTRDLGHVSMGLGGWMHAARTILAQNDTLVPQARDRLLAAYTHHGYRVLTYLNTGTIPAPTTQKGDGGGSLNQAWFGARVLFKTDTPADVVALCNHTDVKTYPAAGANHLVAEAFADAE